MIINTLYYAILRLAVIFLIIIGIFVFVTLSIVIFAKKFNCEEKLFNDRVFSFLGKRKDFKENIKPSITDGALIYTISLICLLFIGSFLQLFWETAGLVATEVMILLIPLLYAIYIKADIKNTFSLKMPKIKHLLGGFIVWFGGYFIINITTQVLLALFPEQSKILEAVNSSVMMDSLLASLIVVALIPAFCEEMLFRGFLLDSFKGESKKSKIWAIVIVGVLFGVMHLNFIRIVPTAILGILFTYCVVATKSIWVSVFMHFLNNGFSVCVMYLTKYYDIPIDTSVTYSMPPISSILVTAGIGVLFIYLGSLCFKDKKEKNII